MTQSALNAKILPVTVEELCQANYDSGKKHGRGEGFKEALTFIEKKAGEAFVKGGGSNPEAWKASDEANLLRRLIQDLREFQEKK